jgi:hypothetical protein
MHIRMTGIGTYYPDRRETQWVGLAVDVPVPRTVAGMRAGRDELFDQAVVLITRSRLQAPPYSQPARSFWLLATAYIVLITSIN